MMKIQTRSCGGGPSPGGGARHQFMANRFISGTMVILLFFGMFPMAQGQAAVGMFSDVSGTNRNADAINFLANDKIISGYPDGTFKPDQPVSRVEFLKLALLASKVKLDDATPTGFSDVDETAWYAPYLQKAKKEGWAQGYADNTFKPTQSVNKVEGLKILAEIQGWKLPAVYDASYKDAPPAEWFGPLVAYAKLHGLLEETGDYFIPSGSLSRAKTAEILFRTRGRSGCEGNETCASNTAPPPDEPPAAAPDATTDTFAPFTPVTFHTASKTFFDNVTLDEDFPNIFYKNELYVFKGKINSGSFDSAFAFTKNDTEEDFENSSDEIKNGRFEIPVIFRKPGNYKFGVMPGSGGMSKYVEISVLPDLPQPDSSGISTIPVNLHAGYADQKTTFTWDNGGDNLAKINFSQGGVNKTFFTRQNSKQFNVIYNDLQNFKPGQISWTVQSAKTGKTQPLTVDTPWITSQPQTFVATTHTFSIVKKDLISYLKLPEILNIPGNIAISGKTSSNIEKDAEIIRPDGKVDTISLQTASTTSTHSRTEIIPSGGDYLLNYQASTGGTYIVEINGEDGLAVINTPVYVGNGIPFVPDFFDLTSSTVFDTASGNILINKLLNLINRDRVKYGLNAVNADATLNKLAQDYSDEMWTRGFFGHVDPDGKTTDDRRVAMKITTQVGENIVDRIPNVVYGHNGLMRSAIHRVNILDPDWTRVGIGITKKNDGLYIIVEEFSTAAPDLNKIKNSLMDQINQKRKNLGIDPLSADAALQSFADNWSGVMAAQKFLGAVAPDGSSIVSNIQKTITDKPVQIYVVEGDTQSTLAKELSNGAQETLLNFWKTAGMGINIDENGVFKLTLLLSY